MTIRCPKGRRRCTMNNKCFRKVRKTRRNSKRCQRGTRKCRDRKCWKKQDYHPL